MALQDILSAIVSEADGRIAGAQAAHKKRTKEMKDAHEKELHDSLRHITLQKETRKVEMRQRAEGHARMLLNHAQLTRKQEMLDSLYGEVVDQLAAMPKAELESWLETCLSAIKDTGTIHPAKEHEAMLKKLAGNRFTVGEAVDAKGGFRFEGEKSVHDYTFEFLVSQLLRPETEIQVAGELFSA